MTLRNRRPSTSRSRSLALAAGGLLVGVGALLIAGPDAGRRLFGLDDAAGLARATGLRQAYLGALVLGLGCRGRTEALGWLLISLGVIPVGDAMIALHAGGRRAKAAEHLLGLSIVVVGAGLVRDRRADARRAELAAMWADR